MVRSDIAQSAGDAVADSIGRLEDQVMEEIGLLRKEVTDLKFWVIGCVRALIEQRGVDQY